MLRKLYRLVTGSELPQFSASPRARHQQHLVRRQQLLQQEALVGGSLFGAVPAGHQREFFCLDRYTWVWFESWRDAEGQPQQLIVRYEAQPGGVLKTVNGEPAGYTEGQELDHLLRTIDHYTRRVSARVYGQQLATA